MSRSILLCAVVLLCAALVSCELLPLPIYRTATSDFKFHHSTPTGDVVHVEYHGVKHPAQVIKLDEHFAESEMRAHCQAQSPDLTLMFRTAELARSARIAAGSLLSGGVRFHCDDGSALLFRVNRIISGPSPSTAAAGSMLVLDVTRASALEFFETVHALMRSNVFPAHEKRSNNFDAVAAVRGAPGAVPVRERSWLSNWLSSIWHAIVSIADDVWNFLKNLLPKIETLILTGNLVFSNATLLERNITYNYPNTQPINIPLNISNVQLECSDCFAFADLTVEVAINITNYRLEKCAAIAYGDAELMVALALSASYSGNWNWGPWTLTTISPPPLIFTIAGIPFTISFDVPITAGASLQVGASATAAAHASVSGAISFGYEYVPANKSMIPVVSHSWNAVGQLDTLKGEVEASVTLYIQPIFTLSLDYIGSVYLSAQPSVEVTTEAVYGNGEPTVCGDDTVYVNVAAGAVVTYGALVDLHLASLTLWEQNFGPYTLYSVQTQLAEGCYNYTDVSHMQLTPPEACCAEGMVWSGTQQQIACWDRAVIAPGNVSLQLIQNDDDGVYFVMSVSEDFSAAKNSPEGIYGICVSQVLMEGSWDPNSLQLQLNPVSNAGSMNFANCVDGQIALAAATWAGVQTDRSLQNLLLYADLGPFYGKCATIDLSRASA